jgi:hypothetical protein
MVMTKAKSNNEELIMPNVGGKFFPYSKEGMASAKKAEAKLKADAMLKSKAKPKDKNKKITKPKAKAKAMKKGY